MGARGRVSGGSGEGTRRDAREGSGNGGCSASRGWDARPRAPLLHLERHGGRVTGGCRVELLLQRLSAAFQSGDSRAARPVEMHARPILPSAPPRVLVRHPGVRRVRVVAAGVRARVPRRRAAASPVFSTSMFSSSKCHSQVFPRGTLEKRWPTVCRRFKIPDRGAFFFHGDIFKTSEERREPRGERAFEVRVSLRLFNRGGSAHPVVSSFS